MNKKVNGPSSNNKTTSLALIKLTRYNLKM